MHFATRCGLNTNSNTILFEIPYVLVLLLWWPIPFKFNSVAEDQSFIVPVDFLNNDINTFFNKLTISKGSYIKDVRKRVGGGQAKADIGGQAKLDVHIWLKFDKCLISNLSLTAEIWQTAAINSYNSSRLSQLRKQYSMSGAVFWKTHLIGTSLEIQNRITMSEMCLRST